MGIKLLPRSVSSQTETINFIFWTASIHTIKKDAAQSNISNLGFRFLMMFIRVWEFD